MTDIIPVKNALISVYYKNGIVDMAQRLHEQSVVLYSSGGTAAAIRGAGIPVTDVASYTQSPALFGHRVVTLHPKVHGGILFRRDQETDLREAAQYGVISFDLVVVNFYPVEEEIARSGATIDSVVEQTDIGGPAMARAAAKNHKHVAAVIDPSDYIPVAEKITTHGGLTLQERQGLALKVFARTSAYDAAIAKFYQKVMRNNPDQRGE